jgi:hypothetical protein
VGDGIREPRLSIATPATWVQLDLDPATRAASIQRLVKERAEAFPEAARFGPELARSLEATVAAAQEQGGVFAAVFSTVSDGKPVGASVVVSLIPRANPSTETSVGDPRRVLAEGFRERYAGPETDVAVVDLPPGPATRVRRRLRAEVPVGSGGPAVGADVEQVQYFVPLPGVTHLALLSFSTPNLGLAEPFGELFEAMARTLTWT